MTDRLTDADGIVCAWCSRIRTGSEWRHADDLVATGTGGLLVGISHGICPDCSAKYEAELDVLERKEIR